MAKVIVLLWGLLLLSACGSFQVDVYKMPPNTVDCDNFDVTHECTVEADSNE